MSLSDRSFAIVVVAHREYDVLGLCLSSLSCAARQPRDVIFVDNGSGGGLTAWATEHFPEITVLTLEQNRMFCGGYNAGIRLAIERGYSFVLIVNADTEVVSQNFINDMVEAMGRWPLAAFSGPMVWFREKGAKQNTVFKFPSFWRTLIAWPLFRIKPDFLKDTHEDEHEVDVLNGVCVLCRCSALAEFGLMDETLGAYVEDTDWAWRAKAAGWKSVYVPVESIIHHEEPTGYEHHSFKTFLLKRNNVRWYLKSQKRAAAFAYALLALILARLRKIKAPSTEAAAFCSFADELERVYRNLLSGKALGPWFGAPLNTMAYGEAILRECNENQGLFLVDPLEGNAEERCPSRKLQSTKTLP